MAGPVNPYAKNEIVHALRDALRMKTPERIERFNSMVQNVKQENVFWWVDKNFQELKKAIKGPHQEKLTRFK